MERLTEKHYLGADHYMKCSENCDLDMNCIDCPSFERLVERLAAYEDTGLEPEQVDLRNEAAEEMAMICQYCDLDRLEELAKADKEGRVVVLPCKVGDTVWAILDGMKHARKCVVEFVNIGSPGTTIVFSTATGLREQYGVTAAAFGKTVFLTREEAERALRGAENG